MNAQEIARRSAAAMWADDKASQSLGIEIVSVGPGTAVLAMIVGPTMVNGLDVCHGGFIFTLADSACAFASNSYNQRALLQSAQIALLAPARIGMRLIAEARERHRAERNGIYDVTVMVETGSKTWVVTGTEAGAEAGTVIAEFRGHIRIVPGSLFAAQ